MADLRAGILYFILIYEGEEKGRDKINPKRLAKSACMPREQCHHYFPSVPGPIKPVPTALSPLLHNDPSTYRLSHRLFHPARTPPDFQRQTNIMSSEDIVVRSWHIYFLTSIIPIANQRTKYFLCVSYLSIHPFAHPPTFSSSPICTNSPETSSPSTTVLMAVVKAS